MCQRCLDAVKRYWPDLPKEDYVNLLWTCTAFPASTPEQTEQQIREMAEKSGCNLQRALEIVEAEMDMAMSEARGEQEE